MKKIITVFLFGFIASTSVYSQLSTYSFQSLSSTFTALTSPTVLGTTSNDEQVFNNNTTGETAPQTDIGFPIGFSFFYNGTSYDKFAVNNNGWILLGTGTFVIGATITPISTSSTTGFVNTISALGRDLQGQSGSSLSYKLIGISPNRVMVVQWLNYRRYNIASGESFNFQVRLNESDNSVSFIYGTVTTTNSSTTNINNPTQVGLRGAANSDYRNRTSTSSWSSSAGGTLNTNTMFLTTTVKPASGLEYKWTPANMTFTSSTTQSDDTTPVKKYSVNNVIIKVQVITAGSSSPLSATSITFNTTGSTNVSDISNAKVWFTGTGTTFNTSDQFGTVTNNPNGSFTVNGTEVLATGTNYFWLTYDIKGTAVTGHQVDAQCNSITIVSARIPTVQSPSGFRTITNAPLQGTFNIGLALFKIVSGKELYYSKSSRMKLRAFPKERNEDFIKEPKNAEDFYNTARVEYREIPEDVYTLMEGNAPYTGPLCIRLTEEIKSKLPPGTVQTNAMGVYASISDAFNDISANGLDGAVEFLLVDEVYSSETFPIELDQLNGSTVLNTFSLKPAPGVTPQIIMNSGESVIKIYNSDFVTIDGSNTVGGLTRDLSIISTDGSLSYGVWIGSKPNTVMTDITVKNCLIKTGEYNLGSTPLVVCDVSSVFNEGYFDNVTISNNVIQKGYNGIFVNGGTSSDGITNLVISDNVINSSGTDAIESTGIYVQGINKGIITRNDIGNISSSFIGNDKGIWAASGSHNLKIEKNKIYNIGYSGTSGYGGYGIYLTPSHINALDTVSNNVIYNIFGDGSNYLDVNNYLNNPAGIVLFSTVPQSGISVLNNSINLYGNTLVKPYASSFGIFVSTNSTAGILNNVICNNLGVGTDTAYGSFGIYAQSSNTQFTNIDYNNYYINPTGNGVKIIGKISGTTATTLNSWRSATLQDRSSISYDPGFTSSTNLSPDVNSINSWSLNGRGVQNNSAGNDFNGSLRSTTLSGGAPDIGAYEFTPVSLPLSLTGTGTYTDGGNLLYIFGSDTVASVTWHGVNLPSALTLRYYSGTNPPSPSSGKYGNGYWVFTPTGGSGYTFDMNLYWDPAAIGTILGVSNITMANYTSSVWEHYDATVNLSSRKVTKTGLTKLSTFTIDDGNAPLPVSILYFNNTVEARNVSLKWGTSFEINNKGFEIEKNSDLNSEWKKIEFINGKGTSNVENNYEFKDINLMTGSYHYRLKQIDYSGSSEYFTLPLAVTIGKPLTFDLGQNYPNPSNPKAKIEYQVPFDSKLSIKVFNIQGREVKTLFDAFSPAGYYSIEFDGSDLASGIYFYRIVSENYVKTMKLILVK